MATVPKRRIYLGQIKFYSDQDSDMESVFMALHAAATPATPLPTTTPGYSKLVANRYTCIEDVTGASAAELVQEAGLSYREAAAVIAAYPLT